jgi:GntR family transcriptional regulator
MPSHSLSDDPAEHSVDDRLNEFAERNQVSSDAASVPLYYQLFRLFQRFLFERHLRPGDRFPSEEMIANRFNVSRPTANRATRELLKRGWLYRERGRGTFVADGSLVELTLLSDELSLSEQFSGGRRLTSRTLDCRRKAASHDVAMALDLKPRELVFELRRLRCIDRRPILVSETSLAAAQFAGFGTKHRVGESLFAALRESYGTVVAHCERWLEASEVLDEDVAEQLQVPVLAPVLMVRGLAYTADEKPVVYMRSYVREGVSFLASARPHPNRSVRAAKTFAETVEWEEETA